MRSVLLNSNDNPVLSADRPIADFVWNHSE